jgi:hypothetical protein
MAARRAYWKGYLKLSLLTWRFSGVRETLCMSRAYLVDLAAAIIMLAGSSVEAADPSDKANREYQERQHRMRCEEHPNGYCLTRPEREIDKTRREDREGQFRIRTRCATGDRFWPECIAVGVAR